MGNMGSYAVNFTNFLKWEKVVDKKTKKKGREKKRAVRKKGPSPSCSQWW